MKQNSCPFCTESESYRYVRELEYVRAIYPLNPACSYHVLLTPKRHVSHVDELNPHEWQEILQLVRTLQRACQKNISTYIGYNLLSNNGDERVNQKVDHCHMHMFIRTSDDSSNPLHAPHSASPSPSLTKNQRIYLSKLQKYATKTP